MQARQPLPSTEDVIDVRDYIAVLRRQALVIVLLAVGGLGLALVFSAIQTPTYTARAEVLIRPPTGFSQGARLDQVVSMDTEARLVVSAPIAEAANEALGTGLSITQLLKHVSVDTAPDTLILDVLFWDTRPGRAAEGANAFADAYLTYKRDQALEEIAQQRSAIEQQMAELRRQQREQTEILEGSDPDSPEYLDAQEALDRLDVQVAVLASQLASIPSLVDPGDVILPATAPASPSSPKYPVNAAVGLFLGLFLGIVAAFLRDRADDRVHGRRDVSLYLRTPILAYIPHVRRHRQQVFTRLIVETEPRSPAAEAYRTARTSVLALASRGDYRVLAIVSPLQREGKTTTAANLAAALGHADKRVLVASVDLRKPRIHEFFRISNDVGLSDVLTGEMELKRAIVKSDSSSVWILPGGHPPARPAELLQGSRMAAVVEELRADFDFVVLDCPPVLGLADCLALVPLADAVFMVIAAEQSQGGAIMEAYEQLDRVGGAPIGAFLNNIRVPRGSHQAYGYYLPAPGYLEPTTPPRSSRVVPGPADEPAAGNGEVPGTGVAQPAKTGAKEPSEQAPAVDPPEEA